MERRRRSVAGIALEGGRIFVARRKPGGDLGGKWEFPGGKAEEGESDEAALVREFGEEFGLLVSAGPRLAAAVFEHRGAVFDLHAYRVFFGKGPPSAALPEHEEWRWAALDEIRAMDFADSDRALLPGLEAYLAAETGVQH